MFDKKDTLEAVQLEEDVADAFTKRAWSVDQNIYYNDIVTNKFREIDVYAQRTFDSPRRFRGTGAPLINLEVICECKSLTGLNVVFIADKQQVDTKRQSMKHFTIHDEDIVRALASSIFEHSPSKRPTNLHNIYKYINARIYLEGEVAIDYDLMLPFPPVEFVASFFIETKSGEFREAEDSNTNNPFWKAVTSIRSSTNALLEARKQAVLSTSTLTTSASTASLRSLRHSLFS